ncbi:MAG TPA: LPS export ABC transporter permease LptF [Pseudomonadales bacterium]|jgi:lipopolysaccharide export system permease protein|nr:LPS export ABC transporter permease LptF [Pseudomonadales bacterium]HNL91521.1 LPS export ABC transporter permease LptF [Pseudomonadales bacterium]HNN86930.1 LPS export ABC transporter permease LptF [Pseudomonadales bacterium]
MLPRFILARYFAREILQTTFAVTLILLLIFLSGKFAKYLADAASGKISAEIIAYLLLYRAPSILQRILPLGLFLGILLVFGRMYVENEITAMHTAGIGVVKLLLLTSLAVVPVAVITGWLALYVSPEGFQRAEQLLNGEKKRSDLDLVEPGKFLDLRTWRGVLYTGNISDDRKMMEDVFAVEQHNDGAWTIFRSSYGSQYYDELLDARYTTLNDGVRYTLRPGEIGGERLRFSALKQHMKPSNVEYDVRRLKEDTLPLPYLFKEIDSPSLSIPNWRLALIATIQWRFSLVLLVLLVTVLAVAMSRTTPRQGRYVKLLPAMLLYFAYMTALDILRRKMSEGDINIAPGMLTVHVLFLAVAILLLFGDRLLQWRRHS